MGIPVETTEGRQTREFNYVDNIVDGFIYAAENLQFLIRSLILEITVKLPFAVQKSMNFQNLNQSFALEFKTVLRKYGEYADNSRAQEILGWSPKISFEEGMSKTIEWFRKYLEIYYNRASALNQL